MNKRLLEFLFETRYETSKSIKELEANNTFADENGKLLQQQEIGLKMEQFRLLNAAIDIYLKPFSE
jgi:hypothetical protein